MLIVGVGTSRGNDAIGLWVVDRLQRRGLPSDVTLCRRDRPDAGLLDELERARAAVVVDALRTGSPPGRVVRLPPALLTRAHLRAAGGLRIAELLSRADSLERRLPPLRFIGVEVDAFDGAGLSAPVAAAIEPACEAVLAALAELRPLV